MTTNAMKTQHRTRAALPLEGKRTLRRSPLVPHLAFWSVGLLAKVVCPVSLKWLAYDSITTLLLSVWYPLCATIALIHREEKNRSSDVRYIEGLQIERQFWIEYWSVGFAGVQFLQQLVSLVPPLQQMGRYDYPNLPVVLNEIKLLFFVWIFVMEPLLECYQRSLGVGGSWKKFAPLAFLTQAVGPRLMRVQTAVSEQISRDTWQRVIQRKAQRVLELMVVMQFLEEESMAYLLQLLEEGRSLLLLSVFMVLPSSICQVGMLYAQFLFPSARSLAARGNPMEVLSLKYWVLNSILTLFLSATWWLWWCIPFSSQLILGIRCFATFPSTIAHHYSAVEMELITFGILKGEPKLTVKETRTVQALRAVVKRLPRDKQAQSFQFEIDIDSDSEGKSNDGDSSVGSVETTESEDERRRKHRREKRAKKRLLKEKKLGSSNTRRPPPLLSESFIAQYDDENDHNEQRNNGFIDNDEKYSSFINSNKNCEDKSDNNVIDLTQYGEYSTEKEERDARNAAAKDSATRAEIGYTTSAESNSSLPSCYSSIATPTENIIGEVEVQVRSTTRRLESNENETSFAPLFPVTHPKSSGSNSIMQTASSDESLSLSKAPQSSNDELSEIDLNGRNEINESCESWNSSHEESTDGKKTTNVDDEIISSPRRSSRLIQLREWQERKREEEESKKAKKSKLSKKPRPEGSREKVPEKSSKSSVKKPKKSTSDREKKKVTASSPKKSSKKSKTTTTPSKQSAEASVKSKITKQSSPASSPEKTTKDSKKKGARSLEPDVEGSRSSTSSPQKTPKSKPKKVPNSSKKKKKKETSGLGGLLSRK